MPTTPEPECVRIKREAQTAIAEQTAGMSRIQRDAAVNQMAAEMAKHLGIQRVSDPIGRGNPVGPSDQQPMTSAA